MSQQPRSAASSILAFFGGTDPIYRERSIVAIVRLLFLVSFYYAIGAALIMYWPAWRATYQTYFRSLGNASFETFLLWPKASMHFLDLNSPDVIKNIRAKAPPLTMPDSFPVPQRDKVKDTLVLLKSVDAARPGLGQLRTGSRLIGYWPTLTVLALALATPWIWRRKIWLILWLAILVHAFIIFRLAIYGFQGGFADPKKSFRLFTMSDWWFEALKRFDSVINDNPTINFIAPVMIWLVVVVGMELWPAARQKMSGKFKLPRSRREERRLDRGSAHDWKPSRSQSQSRKSKR